MINEKIIKDNLRYKIPVHILAEVDSTNRYAKSLAENSDFTEALVIARRQTAGRGRMGRSFYSEGGGLYMSLLLKPDFPCHKAIHITTAAAVAVTRAIRHISGTDCQIKWVNDIFLNDRKICGILTEAKSGEDGGFEYAVLGIGLNLTLPEGGFPTEIAHIAGALFEQMSDDTGSILAAEIVNEFYSLYRSGLNASDYIGEYRECSCIIGRDILVSKHIGGEAFSAVAEFIDDDFRLSVKYPDGSRELLSSGEVSVKF